MLDTFLHAADADPQQLDATDLSEELEQAVRQAHTAFPQLDHPGFVAVLGQRFGAQTAPFSVWLERLQPGDLYLALAAAAGNTEAIKAFEARYRSELIRVAQRVSGPRHHQDDLVQTVLEKVLVGTGKRGPRLAEYAGQGHLENWLRVTALRICLDVVKTGVQHKREDAVEDLSAAAMADDFELEFLKKAHRASFKQAFSKAVISLEPDQRTLLRMSYLRGLSIDDMAGLYHIHRATAARRLGRARESLMTGTHAELAQILEVEPGEIDSIMRLINSQLEVSMERLLRTTLT